MNLFILKNFIKYLISNLRFQCLVYFFRNADQLTIGDELLVQGNNELVPTKVISVSNLIMQGNYVIRLFENDYVDFLVFNSSMET